MSARVKAGLPIMKGRVILTCHFYGLGLTTDLSNAVKLIEDAMNKVVYEDDRQIAELHLYRHETPKGTERTEVFIQ